jgi:hypothetical protein
MGEGDQGREHQGELSGSKHSALERAALCITANVGFVPKDGVIGRRLVDSWKIFGCCASG